jgi:hypothetical protein
MKVGRNEPCPCGSGKKYKRCCRALDRAAGAAGVDVAGAVRRAAAGAGEWQADVVPLAAGVTAPDDLLDQLLTRQRAWERAPHPGYAGDSPMTVVWRERREREMHCTSRSPPAMASSTC